MVLLNLELSGDLLVHEQKKFKERRLLVLQLLLFGLLGISG